MPLTVEEFRTRIATDIGMSQPHLIAQETINAFAALTHDQQFIHVDPVRAANTDFGGTIAHGFLSLSLLTCMFYEAVPPLSGAAMSVNYGFDKIRFLTPVPSGSEIVGFFRLLGCEPRKERQWLFRFGVDVRIKGAQASSLYAEWLILQVLSKDQA